MSILDEATEVVTIPLARVTALSVRHGLTAQRPLLGILLSVPCFAFGALAVRRTIHWLSVGGVMWDVEILFGLLLPVGFFFLRAALRRGFYLLAELQGGTRKLPFNGPLDEAFPNLIRQAEVLIGRSIDYRSHTSLAA